MQTNGWRYQRGGLARFIDIMTPRQANRAKTSGRWPRLVHAVLGGVIAQIVSLLRG